MPDFRFSRADRRRHAAQEAINNQIFKAHKGDTFRQASSKLLLMRPVT